MLELCVPCVLAHSHILGSLSAGFFCIIFRRRRVAGGTVRLY